MIMISFRSKKDKERLLTKAKEMEMYASEIVDCLEEARHGSMEDYDDDEEYAERSSGSMRMRGRYGYNRR